LLSLAAAPSFGIMVLSTVRHGGGMPDMLCAASHEALKLSGMALMSAFHLAPWLRLFSGRRSDVGTRGTSPP
jgi:hypothetical protein